MEENDENEKLTRIDQFELNQYVFTPAIENSLIVNHRTGLLMSHVTKSKAILEFPAYKFSHNDDEL
jgi:hypothetical protein